jgi:hypothetical protein
MTVSPTCVVVFDGGEVCRMMTWHPTGKADLRRGLKLARAAYASHVKLPAPAIVVAHFETADGVALVPYTPEEIAKVCK